MTSSYEARNLRAISFRIASAKPVELPALISQVASQLLDCAYILSNSALVKDSQDGIVVHKFKTQVTALLGSKTAEGRWAGAVLAKIATDSGGLETLSKSADWVRTLLSNLKKPDGLPVKRVAIIALTRIFHLTNEHPALVREITTPGMQTFVTTCLNIITMKKIDGLRKLSGPQDDIMSTIFCSFSHLIPSHPTIFRPHLAQLQSILAAILGSPKHASISSSSYSSAANLYTLLHFSTAKSNNSSPAMTYGKSFNLLINACHSTTSLTYRSVIEDWSPLPDSSVPQTAVTMDVRLTNASIDDGLGFPHWEGIHSGCDRLRSLLSLLKAFIFSHSFGQVSIPVGAIVDVLLRTMSVAVPYESYTNSVAKNKKPHASKSTIRTNDQISQSERDALYVELPAIHTTALSVVSALCERFGDLSKVFHEIFLEQVSWLFNRESFNVEVRAWCYHLLSQILQSSGVGTKRETIHTATSIIDRCCDDILSTSSTGRSNNNQLNAKTELNTNALTNPSKSASSPTKGLDRSERFSPLRIPASELIVASLAHIPPENIAHTLRSKLDRTAILSQNTEAILASTLNPPTAVANRAPPASLLPFLSQASSTGLAVEGLIRPRVPAFRGQIQNNFQISPIISGHETIPEAEDDPIPDLVPAPAGPDVEMAQYNELLTGMICDTKSDLESISSKIVEDDDVLEPTTDEYIGIPDEEMYSNPTAEASSSTPRKTTHQRSSPEASGDLFRKKHKSEHFSLPEQISIEDFAHEKVPTIDRLDDVNELQETKGKGKERIVPEPYEPVEDVPQKSTVDVEPDSEDDSDGFVIPPVYLKGSDEEEEDSEEGD